MSPYRTIFLVIVLNFGEAMLLWPRGWPYLVPRDSGAANGNRVIVARELAALAGPGRGRVSWDGTCAIWTKRLLQMINAIRVP